MPRDKIIREDEIRVRHKFCISPREIARAIYKGDIPPEIVEKWERKGRVFAHCDAPYEPCLAPGILFDPQDYETPDEKDSSQAK